MPSVLIFGANGMAGHVVYLMLKEHGYDVVGVTRHTNVVGSDIFCDIMDSDRVKHVVCEGKYNYVINCAGTLNRNVDTDMYHGVYINSVFPHYLATLCCDNSSKLIHISSDCVFRGNQNEFYREDSEKNAISLYGVSKSLGEACGNNVYTLRTSLVGPEIRDKGIGLFHWFMNNDEVDGFAKVFWTGVTTVQLAKTIIQLIEDKDSKCGLYHVVNNQKISKYELLHLFNDSFRNGEVKIFYNDTIESDKSLYNTKKPDWIRVPDYDEMITYMHAWMDQHANLYSKYLKKGKCNE